MGEPIPKGPIAAGYSFTRGINAVVIGENWSALKTEVYPSVL